MVDQHKLALLVISERLWQNGNLQGLVQEVLDTGEVPRNLTDLKETGEEKADKKRQEKWDSLVKSATKG